MFAVLMVGAACAEAVKDVGASLEIDPRLSLSEEREYKSWASYIRAQLCRADESFGLKNYHRYIGDALNFAPESEYLLEQWCLGRDLARQPERHAADLKPIWEEHPESVRLTMLYLDEGVGDGAVFVGEMWLAFGHADAAICGIGAGWWTFIVCREELASCVACL